MLRLAVIAVVLAGCDQVFGLTDVRAPVDAIDAPPAFLVTGSYAQRFVMNDASFAPIVATRIYPPGTISFAVTLDDGTEPLVTYNADGTFSFSTSRPDQPYRFVVTADGGRAEVQQHARVLDLVSLLAGRPDRVPVAATTVQFPFPASDGTNQPPWILSTGIYTQSYTGQFGPTVSLDWRLATPAGSAGLGMLEASKHDQIMTIEMQTDSTSIPALPYRAIIGVAKASITQAPNSTVTIAGPQAVSRNTCARFTAPNLAEYNRLVAAASRTYTGSSGDWFAYMSPSPTAMGTAGSLYVAYCGFNPVRDLDIAPTFHDPFVGATLLIETAAAGLYNVQLPNTAALAFADVNRRYAIVERGSPTSCTSAKAALTPGVALATAMTLDGTPLDTDAKPIALDLSRPLVVSWTLTPGPVEFFGVTVLEVSAVNGVTTAVARVSISVAGQTTAMLDAALFAAGHTYMIGITTSLGRPNAEAGDWSTLQMPFENATMWSHYFEVKPL